MRQKVALAGALVHDPKLIILDEPLTGLDARAARLVKDVLLEKVRHGCTVIMTTHILEVAERMAERIGVISRGKLIAEGTLDELRHQAGSKVGDTSLEDVFLTLVADEEPARVIATQRRTHPRSLLWLSRQESRLSWRDLVWLMTAGYRWRGRSVVIWLLVRRLVMHFIAWGMVARYADVTLAAGVDALTAITGSIGLAFFLMLSQALEQVTRLFYGRGDLDLLKSSPVSLRRVLRACACSPSPPRPAP